MLQKTHLNDAEHVKLQQEGFYLIFFASFNIEERAVDILFWKNSTFKIPHYIKDGGGVVVVYI